LIHSASPVVEEVLLVAQHIDAWRSAVDLAAGFAKDVWFLDSERVPALLLVLLQYGPSRPMQMPCDLMELEPMELVLVPLELEVLVLAWEAQDLLKSTVVVGSEVPERPAL
jgi:hypothetical protein